ncbi:MAG: hypothetical protein QXW42_04225 [Thermofilum sp.]
MGERPPMPSDEFLKVFTTLFSKGDFRTLLALSNIRYMGSGIKYALVRLMFDLAPKFMTKVTEVDPNTQEVVERLELDVRKALDILEDPSKSKEEKEEAQAFLKYLSFFEFLMPVVLSTSPFARNSASTLLRAYSPPRTESQYVVQLGGKGGVWRPAISPSESGIEAQDISGQPMRRRKPGESLSSEIDYAGEEEI